MSENIDEIVPEPAPNGGSDNKPEMSEIGTLASIFFEPERTFRDLRRKPRFIAGTILIALLVTAYGFGLYYKVGEDGMRRFMEEQFNKSSQTQSMSNEQKSNAIDLQLKIQGIVRYIMPVFVIIALLIGGLLYFAGTKAFGGSGGFLSSLSVWIYSSIPPAVVGMIGSFIVLAFKSADEIDVGTSQRGVLHANLGFLVDGKAHPVIATLISTADVFMIWGWILAAIGLRVTNRLSSGSSWALVIIIGSIGVIARVISAIFSGNPS